MAIIQNQIDEFTFIDLAGMPDVVKNQVAVLERHGVDGTTIVKTGKRGAPFTLRSKVDAEDLAAGLQAFNDYTSLLDTDPETGHPVDITYQDQDLSTGGLSFIVLDVKLAVLKAISGPSGGLNPPSRAWLECDWTIVPWIVGD